MAMAKAADREGPVGRAGLREVINVAAGAEGREVELVEECSVVAVAAQGSGTTWALACRCRTCSTMPIWGRRRER